MVEWVWVPVALIAGSLFGVFLMAAVNANRDRDD